MATEAISKANSRKFYEMLESSKSELAKALPKHLTSARVARAAWTAYQQNPPLALCDPRNVIMCILEAAQMGLELGTGPLAQAYFVPFRNKQAGWKCQLMVGYRGLIVLAMQSGFVNYIDADLVYENDVFRWRKGSAPLLEHEPAKKGPRGKVTHAYAVAHMRHGPPKIEVMTRDEIEEHRQQSQAKDAPGRPWREWWGAMARKTVIRQICKTLPMSSELRITDEIEAPSPIPDDISHEPVALFEADYDSIDEEKIDESTGEVIDG